MKDYFKSHYDCEFQGGTDAIRIRKNSNSEWLWLCVKVGNSGTINSINIRSKQDAEHLHFMLGQALGKE